MENEYQPPPTHESGTQGHFEFSICDASDVGMPTQACFNQYPLTRANGDDDNSPIDPNYPGRYYLAPPCTAYERGQGINRNVDWDKEDAYEPYVATVRYNLPEITCTHCILQMHYCEFCFSANLACREKDVECRRVKTNTQH